MILYRDDHIVIADKPSGLLVHRGWGADRDVFMMRVRDEIGMRVQPVHRLDRGASGAVVFGLTLEATRGLGDALAARTVDKRYVALVRGVPDDAGNIDYALRKERRSGDRQPSITGFRRLATFGRYSLVAAYPKTGRLHQIRRHFKHISHPLIGDVNYGKGEHNRLFRERFGLHRLALHAVFVAFDHPITGARVRATAPLPDDLAEPMAALALQEGVAETAVSLRALCDRVAADE